MLSSGDTVARYTVEHHLGTIALGELYRVSESAAGTFVLLVLDPLAMSQPDLAEDLEDLIHHHGRVRHPNVVPIRGLVPVG